MPDTIAEIITDAEMEHLMLLARIDIPPSEVGEVKADLNAILGYFQTLQRLDLDGLPEMARPVALVNVLRDDEPEPALPQAEALALGVETEEGFFRVPRLVD